MKKAPGKSHREGISLEKLFQMFPDDATAEKWFVEQRWPDGAHCPHCGSVNVTRAKHRTMPYLCRERECRKRFSVRIGTPMECSKLGYKDLGNRHLSHDNQPQGRVQHEAAP